MKILLNSLKNYSNHKYISKPCYKTNLSFGGDSFKKSENKRIEELKATGVEEKDKLNEISSLSGDEYSRAIDLIRKGVNYKIFTFEMLYSNEKSYDRFLELINEKMDCAVGAYLSSICSDKDYKKAFNLAQMRFTSSIMPALLNLDDDKLQEITEKIDKNYIKNLEGEGFSVFVDVKNMVSDDFQIIINGLKKDDENNSEIKFKKTIDKNGQTKFERSETIDNKEKAILGSDIDREYINIKLNDKSDKEITIIKDEGEPSEIIVKEKSPIIEGTYNRTKYILSNYPENYDLIQALKDGSIYGGIELSKSLIDDNKNKIFKEHIEHGNYLTDRCYKLTDNGYQYNYRISDNKGNVVLYNQITFEKISPSKAKTTINDTEYLIEFDDENKKLVLSSSKGTQKTSSIGKIINEDERLYKIIKNLPANLLLEIIDNISYYILSGDNLKSQTVLFMAPVIKNNTYFFDNGLSQVEQTYNEAEEKFKFKKIITKEGLDKMGMGLIFDESQIEYDFVGLKEFEDSFGVKIDEKMLKKIMNINISALYALDWNEALNSDESDFDIGQYIINFDETKKFNNILQTGENLSVIAHELGHSKGLSLNLNKDKKLIEIYEKELEKFDKIKNSYKEDTVQFDYFGKNSASTLGGLSELIAETNLILTTIAQDIPETFERSQLLVENFPETISYIASKLGLNSIKTHSTSSK